MAIKWKDEFLTGLDEIDAQHHYFFQLIKRIERFKSPASDETAVVTALLELRKYAGFHFASEEHLMGAYDYPGLSEHEKVHRNLTDQLQAQFEAAMRPAANLAKLKMFLYTWFAGHTTHDDQMYARHIKGVRKSARNRERKLAGI
jgi:hemerythrin